MKTTLQLVATSFVLCLCLPLSAYAQRVEYAMTSAKMDPHHVPPLSTPSQGRLLIDNQRIELFVDFEKKCPPGYYCSDEMPEPIHTLLPIVGETRGACVLTYVAYESEAPVDGLMERIIVRVPTCTPTNVVEDPTAMDLEVTYSTEGYENKVLRLKYDSLLTFQPR